MPLDDCVRSTADQPTGQELVIAALQAELYCVRRDREWLREFVRLLKEKLDLLEVDRLDLGRRYDALRRDLTQAEIRYRQLRNRIPTKARGPSTFGSHGPPTGKKPPDGLAVAPTKPRKRGA